MTLLSSSFFTVLSLYDLLMTELAESGFMSSCDKDDMSTITTIPTKWSSFWDIFLTTPRDDTVTSFACF